MAFLVNCDQKKCGKYVEPALDLLTNQAICPECNRIITNLTTQALSAMKSMGQIKRNDKKSAYSIFCQTCKQTGSPKINDQNQITCGSCKAELKTLTTSFQKLIRDNFKMWIIKNILSI